MSFAAPARMTSLSAMERAAAHQQNLPASGAMLPHDPSNPAYTDDNFMMFCFKVLPCEKTYRHDWWACPFVHPGESAKRRDPRRFKYSAVACPNAKQGGHCPRGDRCPGTHSVFEYWLHPSRFRTQFCDRGIHCNQPFCFFAHTVEQLRMPSAAEYSEGSQSPVAQEDSCSTAASFDRAFSMRSMSFDKSNASSFDGTSPRIPAHVLSEVQNSFLARGQPPATALRHYPELGVYDSSSRGNLKMAELHGHMPPKLVHRESRSFGHSRSFPESRTATMVEAMGAVPAGATPRGDNHLRSISLVQDMSALQEILEQMSAAAPAQANHPVASVAHITPPVWAPSYSNLGSPNSPLVTKDSGHLEGHEQKFSPSAADLEGAMAQLSLSMGTPMGLSR